jgi:hypothetical protein
VMRLKLLQPPGVIKTLKDVFVLHGAPSTANYIRSAATATALMLSQLACSLVTWTGRGTCCAMTVPCLSAAVVGV